MSERTVVLLAHGSPDPRHREALEVAADVLWRRLRSACVRIAYLETDHPSPADLGAELVGAVVAVPMLLTPAHHARTDIPAAAEALAAGGAEVRLTPPLGPDPLVLRAVSEHLELFGRHADPRTEVLLIAGGSSDGEARRVLVDLVGSTGMPGWGEWHATTLREPDEVRDLAAAARSRGHELVAVSCTLAEGVLHDKVAELCAEHDIDLVPGGLLGTPAMLDLICARAGT